MAHMCLAMSHTYSSAAVLQAMQLALGRWMSASLGSAFATWRAHVDEQALLKDKLQRAVAIMTQVSSRS